MNQAYYFLGGRRFGAYAGEMLDEFEREKPGFEGDYAGCAGLLANVIGDVLGNGNTERGAQAADKDAGFAAPDIVEQGALRRGELLCVSHTCERLKSEKGGRGLRHTQSTYEHGKHTLSGPRPGS